MHFHISRLHKNGATDVTVNIVHLRVNPYDSLLGLLIENRLSLTFLT